MGRRKESMMDSAERENQKNQVRMWTGSHLCYSSSLQWTSQGISLTKQCIDLFLSNVDSLNLLLHLFTSQKRPFIYYMITCNHG